MRNLRIDFLAVEDVAADAAFTEKWLPRIFALPPMERDAIKLFYGIGYHGVGYPQRTREEIGKILDVNPQRVRKLIRQGFVLLRWQGQVEKQKAHWAGKSPDGRMSLPIESLECSVRTYNVLRNIPVETVGEAAALTQEVWRLKGGKKSWNELQEILERMGLNERLNQ